MCRMIIFTAAVITLSFQAYIVNAQHLTLRQSINSLDRDVDGLTQVQQLALAKIKQIEEQQQTLERSLRHTASNSELAEQVERIGDQVNEMTRCLSQHRQLLEASEESRRYLTPQEFQINQRRQQLCLRFSQASELVRSGYANQRYTSAYPPAQYGLQGNQGYESNPFEDDSMNDQPATSNPFADDPFAAPSDDDPFGIPFGAPSRDPFGNASPSQSFSPGAMRSNYGNTVQHTHNHVHHHYFHYSN